MISRYVVKHEASQEGGCKSSMNVKLLADIPCFIGNRSRLTGPLAGDGSHGWLSSSSGHDKPLPDVWVDLRIVLCSWLLLVLTSSTSDWARWDHLHVQQRGQVPRGFEHSWLAMGVEARADTCLSIVAKTSCGSSSIVQHWRDYSAPTRLVQIKTHTSVSRQHTLHDPLDWPSIATKTAPTYSLSKEP